MNLLGLDWKARLVCDVVGVYGNEVGEAMATAPRLHLACMKEPWAGLVAVGIKTVESRWGKSKCQPHGRIGPNDVVIWKRSGGFVYGASFVVSAQTIPIESDEHARDLLRAHGREIRVEYDEHRYDGKRWLTLIRLGPFAPIPAAVKCGKNDQAGWNILQERGMFA